MWEKLKSLPLPWGKILPVLTAILAIILCWFLWRPEPPKQETFLSSHRQEDNSLVLERRPDAKAKPVHQIPKGAKVERIGQATVQPQQTTPEGCPPCSPVTFDFSLIRNPDETKRVIVSSPDGEVTQGVDIPIETAKAYKAKLWAAGAVGDPFKQTWGVFIDRDLGPFRFGAQLNQREGGDLPNQIWVKAGIRF